VTPYPRADARVDQRLIDRREQIVDGPDRPRDERRGDPLRSGFDWNGGSLERQTFLACVAHPLIDLEHGHAFAIPDLNVERVHQASEF